MPAYRVRRGDTLGRIAQRFYGSASRYTVIVAANHIENPDRLAVGQELVIPDAGGPMDGAAPAPGLSTPSPAPAAPGMSLSDRKLATVHPILAIRARALLALGANAGSSLLVTQGLRTWEEQDALYAKGRTVAPIGKQYIVTNAKGGQSYHNFGLAFDVAVLDAAGKLDWDTSHPGWVLAGRLGKSVGLEWGGDWKSFRDLPHFQFTGGLSLATCRELFPQGLPVIWERVT